MKRKWTVTVVAGLFSAAPNLRADAAAGAGAPGGYAQAGFPEGGNVSAILSDLNGGRSAIAPVRVAPENRPAASRRGPKDDAPAPLKLQRSDVNADQGGASFAFVQLTDTHLGEGSESFGGPSYDNGPPDGDVGRPAKTLRAEVEWINAHSDEEGIRFVIITGDLTSQARRAEFLKAKEILDALTVPYVPMLGNHDMWPWAPATKGARLEADGPVGDRYFMEVFGPTFARLKSYFPGWDDGTRLSPVQDGAGGGVHYLQNFAFSYRGYRFVCLDFNSRAHARFDINPLAKIHVDPPGTIPNADFHDVPGGTLPWLRSEMGEYGTAGSRNLLLFAHHPLSKLPIDLAYFSFSFPKYERMAGSLRNGDGSVALWAAGHVHRNAEYGVKTLGLGPTGVDGVETGAAKDGSLRVVTVWGATPE